jgi:DNA-binding MarR family transcriptional regulator
VTRRTIPPRAPTPDAVWRRLVALVADKRDDWRRKMSDATGLPFGRVRALRRLVDRPLTLSELAVAMDKDAPSTTVLVNDLERRGLIIREPHPTNRRAKLVSLTPIGRALMQRARAVSERVPPALKAAAPEDLAAVARIVDLLLGEREDDA